MNFGMRARLLLAAPVLVGFSVCFLAGCGDFWQAPSGTTTTTTSGLSSLSLIHILLSFLADAEAMKDDQKDEEIVHAERGFNGVAAYPFKSGLPALGEGDPCGKSRRGKHECKCAQPRKGLRVARLAPMAGQQRIDDEQRRNHGVKAQPPHPGCARNHSRMLQENRDRRSGFRDQTVPRNALPACCSLISEP